MPLLLSQDNGDLFVVSDAQWLARQAFWCGVLLISYDYDLSIFTLGGLAIWKTSFII